MTPGNLRLVRWGVFVLGALLTAGSFSLSLVGGWTPCIYCLTLRYTGLVLSAAALANAIRPRRFLGVAVVVLSLAALGVAGYLVRKDFKRLGIIKPDPLKALTGGDESCAPGQDCSTPVLGGLPASAYALGGFAVLLAGSVLVTFKTPKG
ncbi:MAG: disulfide bond formation protein B [Nitrospirae bacterium]|nr:disulfide bond formation protein B [Nitrospirota bacterium]